MKSLILTIAFVTCVFFAFSFSFKAIAPADPMIMPMDRVEAQYKHQTWADSVDAANKAWIESRNTK